MLKFPLMAALLLVCVACKPVLQKEAADEPPSPPKALTHLNIKEIPAVQAMATKACLCDRTKRASNDPGCWAAFNARIDQHYHSSVASACGPGSSAYVEFFAHPYTGNESVEMEITHDPALYVTTHWGYGACNDAEMPMKKAEYEARTNMKGC